MYAKGMTTGDIEAHIRDVYGIDVSDTTICRITDKNILPIAKEWQRRPLETVYAVVFLDAIHYHVRSEGQFVKKLEMIGRFSDHQQYHNLFGIAIPITNEFALLK